MASPTAIRLGVVKEQTFKTIPANPAFKTVRKLSSSLAGAVETLVSEENAASRNVPDVVPVGRTAGGDIQIEWLHDGYDDLLEGAMFSTWSKTSEKSGGTDITAVTGSATFDYTTSAATPAWRQYQLIKASGFAQAANNAIFVAQTGTTSTVVKRGSGSVAETPSGTSPRLKCIGLEGPTGEITATATGLGRSGSLIDYTGFGLVNGQWIFIGNPNNANQAFATITPGLGRVSMTDAITASALPLDIKPAGWGVDNGSGKNIRLYFTDTIRNGTTKSSYAFERDWSDITDRYEYFTGQVVDGFTVSVPSRGKMTGQFRLIGADYVAHSNTRFTGASTVAAPTSAILNTSTHVATFREADAVQTANFLTKLDIEVTNNLEADPAVAYEVAIGVTEGRFECRGTAECYFDSAAMVTKLKNGTATSFQYGAMYKDGTNGGLVWDMPKVKFTAGPVQDPGGTSRVRVSMGFQALEYTRPVDSALMTLMISQFENVGA